MSSNLFGLLIILSILIIYLVISSTYKETFFESKKIIARCGESPDDYLSTQKELPSSYYWLPNTISYPVENNKTPYDAILEYEWNKCKDGIIKDDDDDDLGSDDDDRLFHTM